MLKILTFGTFDGVHEGHRAMLRQAKALGDYLVVAVAPDTIVQELKGKVCVNRASKRIEDVRAERIADEVVRADKELNSWKILKKYKPDIIALGYDQEGMREALEAHFASQYPSELEDSVKKPRIVILDPHQPETYKSSLLNPW